MDKKEEIIEAIKTVYDPEIPVNIYDLGLIYKIDVDKYDVQIDMTLTTANCPLADEIPIMVKDAVAKISDINEIVVNLVWDPPWDMSLMSDEARLELNMF